MEDFSGHVQRDSEPGADGLHDGMDVLARKPARPDGTAGARLLHRLRGQRAGRLCLRPATGSRAVPSAKNLRVARLSEMQAGTQAVRARGLRCPGIRLRPLHDGVERKPRQSGAGILRAYGHEKGPAGRFSDRQRLLHERLHHGAAHRMSGHADPAPSAETGRPPAPRATVVRTASHAPA